MIVSYPAEGSTPLVKVMRRGFVFYEARPAGAEPLSDLRTVKSKEERRSARKAEVGL